MSYVQTGSGVLVPANFAAPKRPELNEIATTRDGRDVTRGYVDPLMLQTPRDDVLQLRGAGDYLIYRELLRDDQIGSTFQQRRLAVISKPWGVEAGGDSKLDKAAADSVKEWLNDLGWDRVTDRMLFGVFYGYAVAECMYGRDGRHVTLNDIKVRERRRFGFDGDGRLRMKTMSQPMGELLPERKFWAYSTGADNDDEPYGLGLAHWLYWPAFFKKMGLRYWLTFLERFGQPTAIGKYSQSLKDGDPQIQKLLGALEAIATDSGIAIPQGTEISLLEAARSGTADYHALYEKMDASIAKLVLGQTASTEATPGKLGNDDLKGDVRQDLIKADADLICESFNRSVVRWLTDWNYPGAAYPRIYRKVELDEDLAQRAERDTKIQALGYKPTQGYVTETYGEGWEPAPTPPPFALPSSVGFAAPEAVQQETTPVDLISNQLATQADNEVAQWLGTIEVMLEQAESLEAFREMLLTAFPDLPADKLSSLIGDASMAAQAAGWNDVESENG